MFFLEHLSLTYYEPIIIIMELKEFIKETISAISSGLKESQDELKSAGVIINPKYTVKNETRHYLANEQDFLGKTEVTELFFDVAVEVSESSSGKSGIGISKVIEAGKSKSTEDSNSKMNRISFKVPLLFPPGNPEQKTPRRHGIV